MGTKLTEETTKRVIELDGDIIHTKKGYSALLSQSNYGIYFADALLEIATNKDLNKLDMRLLLLLLAHLTKKEFAMGENRVRLMRGKDYAEMLDNRRPNIVSSFKRIENFGYIKRDKATRSICVTINPSIALREKVSDIDRVYNGLAFGFGNTPIKEKNPKFDGEQQWNSSLEADLNGIDHSM